MIIETTKRCSSTFYKELKDTGLVFTAVDFSTRRKINGKVVKGHPRALVISDLTDADIPAVQAVLDAHVPYFGHVARKRSAVKQEASRRILERMPEWKQRNYIAFNLEMERKERKGGTLTTEEIAMVTFTEGEWEFAKAIRAASNVIEAKIALLTDVEAGEFNDHLNDSNW